MSAATGYYRFAASWLHRRNPLTKLLGLGWVLLAAFLLPPAVLVLLGLLIGVAAVTSGLLGSLVRSLKIPAVLLASILLVNALLLPGAREMLVSLGPLGLSREGLAFGVVSAARLAIAFGASILFLLTTPADDLLEALVARGASHRISFVIASAVQMVPRLQNRVAAILEAQQARGLDISGSLRKRLLALIPLVGPLVLASLVDVRERTFALEARAFGCGRRRTAYRIVSDPPVDRWLRLAIVVGAVGVVWLAAIGAGR